ncbi:hypothetical protein CKQ90_25780, partial [Klebsiella pneumoniae]
MASLASSRQSASDNHIERGEAGACQRGPPPQPYPQRQANQQARQQGAEQQKQMLAQGVIK